jgi:hypothetical protein
VLCNLLLQGYQLNKKRGYRERRKLVQPLTLTFSLIDEVLGMVHGKMEASGLTALLYNSFGFRSDQSSGNKESLTSPVCSHVLYPILINVFVLNCVLVYTGSSLANLILVRTGAV